MEQTKSKRGGRREGAGRKPAAVKRVTVTFCLSPETVDMLRSKHINQSRYIEKFILADIEKAE